MAEGGKKLREYDFSLRQSRREQRSSSGATSDISNLGSGGSEDSSVDENETGYDEEFVFEVDSKYECSICMLVLRKPYQTECGHRFCKACIHKWLNSAGGSHLCPVCNSPLTLKQIWPDNFAQREILSLKVKCRNMSNGCPINVELKNIDDHMLKCDYALEPCPNHCADILLRKDLTMHLEMLCRRRKVVCEACKEEILLDQKESHHEVCPFVPIACDHCQLVLMRTELAHHHNTSCPRALIRCAFYEHGCDVSLERKRMDEHMTESFCTHLNLLCAAVNRLFSIIQVPTRVFDVQATTRPYSIYLGQRDYTNSTLSYVAADLGRGTGVSSYHKAFPMADLTTAISPLDTLARVQDSIAQLTLGDTTDSGITTGSSILPSSLSSYSNHRPRSILTASLSPYPISSLGLDNLQILQTAGATAEGLICGAEEQAPISAARSDPGVTELQNLRRRHIEQDQRIATQLQQIAELQAKNVMLQKKQQENEVILDSHASKIRDLESRSCHGVFLWIINEYSKHRADAISGKNTVIHSPGFYTSFYGYKLCIRVNLNGVEPNIGRYISVFVHFMQGEYDNILEWPFHGQILLEVLDQNSDWQKKFHIQETLVAKPTLAAFYKPNTNRNPKGFGYVEFAEINTIENPQRSYLKNDRLMIRATVKSALLD